MVDASWDNSGLPPRKKGFGTGMKVLMGCGIATLIGLTTCAIGGAILGNMIKKDPKAFERRMEGFARGLVQKDWEHLRALVDQLQTDDGAREAYRANPGLRQGHPSEEAFLQAVRGWRPRLTPLPEAAPMGKHRHGPGERQEDEPSREDRAGTETQKAPAMDIQKIFGTTRIRCRYPDGTVLSMTLEGERVQRLDVE
jgi:hypothetical protein